MNYLTIREAMKIYRVSENTIRRWLEEKRIKGVQIGRKWLVEPTESVLNSQILETTIANALKDFANELLDSCTYTNRVDELEFRTAEFEIQVDIYAKQIVNLISLKEGEK